MTSIRPDITRPDPPTLIALYTLDATGIGGATHRFTTGPWHGAAVTFNKLVYRSVPIEMDGLRLNVDGSAPRPVLRIARRDATLLAALAGTDDLRGATLSRLRTFAPYLDGETGADATRHFSEDKWMVDQLVAETGDEIRWQLASALDLDDVLIPGRVMLREVCGWTYRRYDPTLNSGAGGFVYTDPKPECPYTQEGAGKYFDRTDIAVTAAADDVCSRRLSGCIARFGTGKPLPFGGFIGIPREGDR